MIDRIWYPFTQMTDLPNPGFKSFVRADGNYLFDDVGNSYFDAYSSLWVNLHGHNRPEIIDAIHKQSMALDHTTLLGSTNEPAKSLANALSEIVPIEDPRVFYSDSGSTSVEIACKIAYQYFQNIGQSKKTNFLSLKNAYHGDTLGMVGLGGINLFHEIFKPIILQSLKVSPPYKLYNSNSTLNVAISNLEEVLKEEGENIAAIVMEPILQGAAGMLRIEDGYLSAVRRLCDKYNVLMVIDEVATGFGRTGKMFACDNENVKPDIICIAKGISGGVLPLAATISSSKIFNAFLAPYETFKAFFHGHSYTGNPIACAAALASLKIFENDRVMNHVDKLSKIFEERMLDVLEIDQVLDVRYKGIMGGIEIGESKTSQKSFSVEKRMVNKLCLACISKGIMIRPLGHVIPVVPPLSSTEKEIHTVFDVIKEVIKSNF